VTLKAFSLFHTLSDVGLLSRLAVSFTAIFIRMLLSLTSFHTAIASLEFTAVTEAADVFTVI